MSRILLQAQALYQSFHQASGTVEVLKNVSMALTAGQSLALVGASGSGKSTLLALLAGLDSPSAGRVELFDQDLTNLSEEARVALRCGRVGFVFQNFQLIAHLTALENVLLPLELAQPKTPYKTLVATAQRWLDAVGLGTQARQKAAVLSGGEQQRVALARAFAVEPELIFADEPTGSLDHATGAAIENLLFEQVKARGTSLVLVTHDPKLAARCDITLRIVAGELSLGASV